MRRHNPSLSTIVVLAAFIVLLALPATSTAQQATVDFSVGPTGDIGPTYTDPTTGLQASGMWCNGDQPTCTSPSGVWSPADLWRRNDNDLGLGVCDPSEGSLCTTGTQTRGPDAFNELSDSVAPEVIYLKLPDGYQWVSVTLASLDDNSTDGGPPPERGILWADVDTSPNNGNAEFVTTYSGTSGGAPFAINIPAEFTSSPYLFLEPYDFTNGGGTNNDHLVYLVTLSSNSSTTTTTTSTSTTTLPAETTTTVPASTSTTTTLPSDTACVGLTQPVCDDGDACTVDHCVPGTGCVHDPVTRPDDLDRQSPACVGQPVPPSLGQQFARGCEFIGAATLQPPKKERNLLKKATRILKRAGKAAASAATRKKGPISADCAAELRIMLSGAADQAKRLSTGP